MKAIRVLISNDIIVKALELPVGTQIISIFTGNLVNTTEMKLVSESFPEVKDGSEIQRIPYEMLKLYKK